MTYTGQKIKRPSVNVAYGDTPLSEGEDYTISYDKNAKAIGTYQLKVKGKGNFKGSKKVAFKINPKGTAFTKLTGGKQRITLKWKNPKNITGYQIEYNLKKDFTGANSVKIKKDSTLTTTIKKLKAGKKYYVRIRTYKVVKKKTYYSTWSKTKTVKVKGTSVNQARQEIEVTVSVGDELDLKALLPDVVFEYPAIWKSSDEGVASISETGIARAWAVGKAVITLTKEGEEIAIIVMVEGDGDGEEALLEIDGGLNLTLDEVVIPADDEGISEEIELESNEG